MTILVKTITSNMKNIMLGSIMSNVDIKQQILYNKLTQYIYHMNKNLTCFIYSMKNKDSLKNPMSRHILKHIGRNNC